MWRKVNQRSMEKGFNMSCLKYVLVEDNSSTGFGQMKCYFYSFSFLRFDDEKSEIFGYRLKKKQLMLGDSGKISALLQVSDVKHRYKKVHWVKVWAVCSQFCKF
ncbi:hypothetical protein ILYODFUR_033700 [Ilyodon furcidens]|uniref:Uncharacterized protein n=1 Tax=Ilyodon furcidens TaxID=33524 RepID=A0ABV0UXD9_9TELE